MELEPFWRLRERCTDVLEAVSRVGGMYSIYYIYILYILSMYNGEYSPCGGGLDGGEGQPRGVPGRLEHLGHRVSPLAAAKPPTVGEGNWGMGSVGGSGA